MDDLRSKPVSAIIGNCPNCKAYVRLPVEAKPNAMVRCPHCTETFSVAAVLAQIPELELVENPPPEPIAPLVDRQPLARPTVVERKKFEVPHQLISGSKKRRKRKSDVSQTPGDSRAVSGRPVPTTMTAVNESVGLAESHEPDSVSSDDSLEVMIQPDSITQSKPHSSRSRDRGPREMSATNAARVRVHSSQRYRRMKESSSDSSFEILKILLGGVMAFPIAYLILLWGIGQDPLKLAPSLSKAIPFIVPKAMRGDSNSVAEKKQGRNSEEESEPETPPISINDLLRQGANGLTAPDPGSSEEKPQPVPDVAPDKG